MAEPKKYRSARERQRYQTLLRRRGAGWIKKNASKAGKSAGTHFNSESGKAAARRRWDRKRPPVNNNNKE